MATFNFNGAVSGLDTQSMISALVAAEKLPLLRLQHQRTALKGQQTSWGDVRSLLAKLEAAGKAFTKDLAGSRRTAASSNATVLGATATTSADAATYAINVVRLATATRASSTGQLGVAITDADLATPLAQLSLPGSITAGQVGMVVDGKVVRATIGDPATTTLGDALTAITGALAAQINTNEGGSAASVTASIVDNRVQLSVSGATGTHQVSFGVGGDTSNALGVLGLSGTGTVALHAGAPMTGRTSLGVARTSVPLASAGLAEPVAAAGTLTINGTSIAYDPAIDALSTLIGRINASTAGVVVSMDRANDRLVVTSRSGGAAQIAMEDTGGLLGALDLDTGDAQIVGRQAELTIDGRTYLSDTNKVATAIAGVTLSLLAEGSSTVTVGADQEGLTTALKELVSAYNTLADRLDTLTANKPKQTQGVLAGATELRGLALSLRQTLTGSAATGGRYSTLSQVGVSSGAVGGAVGSTGRLQLNETTLAAALAEDPAAVASLLNSAAGAIAPLVDKVNAWTKSAGRIDQALERITSSLRDMDQREERLQARVDARQAALEKKFASLEATLAQLQTQSSSVGAQVNSMNASKD